MSHIHQNLAFIDIETTGGNAQTNRIIEIGIIRTENDKIVAEWSSLVNPEMAIPNSISQITGISQADTFYAPTFSSLAPEVERLLHNAVFVAHNVRFDYNFLKSEFNRIEQAFTATTLCTVKLSRLLYPEFKQHGLQALIDRFNITVADRHRALDDARAMYAFYNVAKKAHGSTFITAKDSLVQHALLPVSITEQVIANLPEAAGVYMFYNQRRQLIQIGTSKNMRSQVLKHLASDHATSRELNIIQQICTIEHLQTDGQLGATIAAVRLLKQHTENQNIELITKKSYCTIELVPDKEGYLCPKYRTEYQVDSSQLEQYYGWFSSLTAAKSALETITTNHCLCPVRLGLDVRTKRNNACVHYAAGNCSGACIKKISSTHYNATLQEELAPLQHTAWPYTSAIAVTEGGAKSTQAHIIYQWEYIGTLQAGEEYIRAPTKIFDVGLYKLLQRYREIAKKSTFITIQPIKLEKILAEI